MQFYLKFGHYFIIERSGLLTKGSLNPLRASN